MIRDVEKMFKALGDKSRLRIVNMLSQKALCVCEITQVLQLSQSTVSGHLKVLKEARLVEDVKDGLWVEYRLNRDEPFISKILKTVTEALAADASMENERESAKKADREVICKR
jgi:ArsR family transcriptional regulator, arsenate/arsenite/antimonite-responsive transcriptional repressor